MRNARAASSSVVRERDRWGALPAVVIAGALLVGGCGDGGSGGSGGTGGSGGAGGTGGAGGSGGAGGTTTMIAACPIGAELHVAAAIVGPAGVVGDENVEVAGTVTGTGVDTPPTFDCGSGMAWAQIVDETDGESWIGCFQAPGLTWNVTVGQAAQLRQIAVTHPIAPATLHTTLRVDNALVVHVERATVESEVALPDGLMLSRGDQLCSSPGDPCLTKGYDAVAGSGDTAVALPPGEATVVGAHRLYLDRYWIENISSACDGGGAFIVLSVAPDAGL